MKMNPAEITNHKKQANGFLLQLKAKHSRSAHEQRVWQELDYKIDIWRVTKGGHIEHL